MKNRPPSNEISFYFHLDPRLAKQRDCFHFHVLLEDEKLAATPGVRVAAPTTPPFEVGVNWCLPPAGNPVQRVKASSGQLGSVCVIGNGKVDGGFNPDDVVAKIYPAGAVIPQDPPSDVDFAQLVNFDEYPDFTPPSSCGAADVNFVFHDDFLGELPGADSSPMAPYPGNQIAIWLYAGSAVKKMDPQPFRGVTSDVSECESMASLIAAQQASPAAKEPASYALLSQSPFSPQGPVMLRRAAGDPAERLWKSCSKSLPQAQWRLWVVPRAAGVYAKLVLEGAYGARFETPYVWRADNFDVQGVNIFELWSPVDVASLPRTLTVAPG